MQRVLKASLTAKLAGANLIIVMLAWAGVYFAHRSSIARGDWSTLEIMTAALAVGLAVNLVLVSVALRPIRDLEQTATRVWAGDLETRVPRSAIADPDLAQVGGMLNFLLTALAEDRARVRALATEVVRTGDRERARVGKELHDSIAQSLAAIRYQLIAIERDATRDPELSEKIQAVRQSAGDLLEQVRLLSHTVHPQILDDLGLVSALRHMARTTSTGPAISIVVSPDDEPGLRELSRDVAAALYNVAREAVANTLRHGEATTIRIQVGLAAGDVVMQVEDDGRGFDPAWAERDGKGMGLFTMRERIRLLNGAFDITSATSRGTKVCVRVPPGSGRTSERAAAMTRGAPIQREKENAG